jgi:hypothetical protein
VLVQGAVIDGTADVPGAGFIHGNEKTGASLSSYMQKTVSAVICNLDLREPPVFR